MMKKQTKKWISLFTICALGIICFIVTKLIHIIAAVKATAGKFSSCVMRPNSFYTFFVRTIVQVS